MSGLIEELKLLLDQGEVVYDHPLLAGKPGHHRPVAWVKVTNASEAERVVGFANNRCIPITPTSSGHSGIGRRFRSTPGGIIMDLSPMNRILSVDLRNRMVKIQPGVTWGQITAALQLQGMMVMNPLFPLATRSVLTTLLDREPPLNPRFELGEPVGSLEMIWPTGERFRTGSASSSRYPENFSDGTYPYGPGPIDPLRLLQGAQGTMGVVTWANIKMEYRSRLNKGFLFHFERPQEAVEFIYSLQRLRVGNECFMLNHTNMELALDHGAPRAFSVILILSGAPWFPEEKLSYEEEALRELMDKSLLQFEVTQWEKASSKSRPLAEILRSPWPDEKPYWKASSRGAWEEIFFISLVEKTPAFMESVFSICRRKNFHLENLGIYLQPLEYGAGAHLEFDLYYNPQDRKEIELISSLMPELLERLMDLGAHFTRPHHPLISKAVYERCHPSYTAILREIKKLLDPNMVMNPDKLCFPGGSN